MESLPAFPRPHPGPPTVVHSGSPELRQVALTVDDGTSEECVEGYLAFAEQTGTPVTFLPNGVNRSIWEPRAERFVRLVSTGQVQFANHTWSHRDCTRLTAGGMVEEIQRNERWIEQTFGITARPWYRPPFGARDLRTDDIAASIGYTRILMWNGTLGDAWRESPVGVVLLAERWLHAGTIMLGHANHPAVTKVFDQLLSLMADRHLDPVTVDTMFGTSRSVG